MTTVAPGLRSRTLLLAVSGGLGFWLANLAISLTPIAAEYRSALSIPYVPMLLEALIGGLVIGLCVSYALVRFGSRGSSSPPVVRALVLSGLALAVVTVVIEVPSKLFVSSPDPLRYFLIGLLFNAIRILALGVVIGLVSGRRNALPA
jgi:hypothetical protein